MTDEGVASAPRDASRGDLTDPDGLSEALGQTRRETERLLAEAESQAAALRAQAAGVRYTTDRGDGGDKARRPVTEVAGDVFEGALHQLDQLERDVLA